MVDVFQDKGMATEEEVLLTDYSVLARPGFEMLREKLVLLLSQIIFLSSVLVKFVEGYLFAVIDQKKRGVF